MENKMVPAPWAITDRQQINWIYAVNGADDGGDIICDQPDQAISATKWPENSAAIVNAVNSTYGKGIDPSSVPDLLDALQSVVWTSENTCPELERAVAFEKAKAAIAKSIIKQ
jgi:hypothetical protein